MRRVHKIQRQLTLFSLLLITFFCTIIIVALTLYTVRQHIDMQRRSLSSSVMLMENILNDAEYILTKLISSFSDGAEVEAYLQSVGDERLQARQALHRRLDEYRLHNRYIDAFCLYVPEGREIITSYENLPAIQVNDPNRVQWLRVPVRLANNRSDWAIVSGIPSNINDPGSAYKFVKKVSLRVQVAGKVRDLQLCVCLDQSIMRTYVFPPNKLSSGSIAMQDESQHLFTEPMMELSGFQALGERLSALPASAHGEFSYRFTFGSNPDMVGWMRSSLTNWYFYVLTPLRVFVGVLWDILLPALLATLTAIFFCQWYFSRLWGPILSLRQRMQEVENGNMTAYIQDGPNNEFGELFSGYNTMLARINELLAELSDERAFHIDAEIRNLQSQINPHFLYNTLDTIQWMANFGENQKAAHMTHLLANFYRLSLNGGKPMISVEHTVRMMENYFDIHRERSGNRYQMRVTAPPELNSAQMLHNVVQPLVENAINHGLSTISKGGEIRVEIRAVGTDHMEVVVHDSGVGMEPDHLAALQQVMANRSQQHGWAYALTNINQRLRMVYGAECMLRIESTPGVGTTVRALMKL